jgi:hypothetical protein
VFNFVDFFFIFIYRVDIEVNDILYSVIELFNILNLFVEHVNSFINKFVISENVMKYVSISNIDIAIFFILVLFDVKALPRL